MDSRRSPPGGRKEAVLDYIVKSDQDCIVALIFNRYVAKVSQSIARNESTSTQLECTLSDPATVTFRTYFWEFNQDEKLRRDLGRVSDEQRDNRDMVKGVELHVRARLVLETQAKQAARSRASSNMFVRSTTCGHGSESGCIISSLEPLVCLSIPVLHALLAVQRAAPLC